MIFHTSADKIYYDSFFKQYKESITKYYDYAKFSFNYVGKHNFDIPNDLDFFTQDMIDYDEIKVKYNLDNDRNIRGYYCMSRWITIPVLQDHVCVSDIDVIAVNNIDKFMLEDLLEKHKVINLTRIKPKSGAEGGMMVFFLHKDVCEQVKQFSLDLLNSSNLEWDTDVRIREFLYKNFDVKNLLKMQEISKPSSTKIDNPWFIFSKIEKFKNLI